MKVEAVDGEDPRVRIELGGIEAYHLLVFLLHAKFSEDVRMDVVGSPTMQSLLSGLLGARQTLGFDSLTPPGWDVVEEISGLTAPPSFSVIENELQKTLGKSDVNRELEEALFPYTWVRKSGHQVNS